MQHFNDARQAAHEAAMVAAGRTLHQAHKFAALHATTKPLFEKLMRRPGSRPVLVRIVFPGVLLVCDPATGEVLARSMPGQLQQLVPGFVPGASLADENKENG
ncbi:MAG: hypothetical protein KKG12_09045 [Gammaproteobacteria bacterium]|nr:hypothetical protein [Gammaproteobacteria bacterium]